MARTQKNKATSSHLGALKAKLAKLRRELITPKGGGGGPGEGRLSIYYDSLGSVFCVWYFRLMLLGGLCICYICFQLALYHSMKKWQHLFDILKCFYLVYMDLMDLMVDP